MASSVFYKFKSRKDESRVNFDGTGISVFDLKKEIILANNLGKANDFDLCIYDNSSNEELKDDSHIIPRSSSVVVKRVFAKPGKGKAAMYIAGSSSAGASGATSEPSKSTAGANGSYSWHRGNMSKRFDGKEDVPTGPKATTSAPAVITSTITGDDEAKAMAAMFQAQTTNWEETQDKMSQLVSRSAILSYVVPIVLMNIVSVSFSPRYYRATRIYSNPRGGGPGSRGGKPFQHHHIDRPLPPSYVCYRCGQKGHWIQDCPTNNDRDYDNRPRIKRTTGIPRSFLKAVENPSTGQIGHGVMVTPEGGYVVAQPDSASWQKQVSKPKGLSEAEVRERTPSDLSIVCRIDNKLFKDAVKTPCCGAAYCEECVQTHLLERDFICPNCGNKIASLDKLVMDKPTRTKVGDYIDREIEKSKHEGSDEDKTRSSTPSTSMEKPGPSGEQAPEPDYYGEQQPGGELDVSQIVAASIPQLQAQLNQLSIMLSNPTLPATVRQQTEMKYQQIQMELQQAQIASALIQASSAVAAANSMPMQPMQQPYMQQQQQQQQQQQWTNPFSNQQPAGQDSAYQRLPLNNRRRNLKRDRPSDFLDMTGESGQKVPRYWE